jgi:iron complex outermembrane recepter protein
LHVSSDLGAAYGWKLPLAKNGIGVAAGFEHRTEKLTLNTDAAFSLPDLAGQGGPTIGLTGQYTVNEAFGEVRVPIMEGQPWADTLSVNASYRYSSYTTGPKTNTYGLGAEWAPVKEARLRGTYQAAVRAPNIIELFTAHGPSLFVMDSDPCGPTMAATVAQCELTGLPASKYGSELLDSPAGQYNAVTGGNPKLTPEKSTSYTFGVVLQPLRGLSATVDYWNIKVNNTIGAFPPPFALNQCLNTGLLCNFIHRDALGTLWLSGGGYIDGSNINVGTTQTSGIDVTATWNYSLQNYGSLGISFTGTWVSEFITQQAPGFGFYNCAGFYGNICGNPMPRWRNLLQTTWNTPWDWNAGFRWRYFGPVAIDASSGNPQLSGDYNPVEARVGAQNYLDLFAQWNINKSFTLRAGVNNVFDHDPPIFDSTIAGAAFGNGNTFPQIYDTLGRNFFVSLQAKF